MRARDNPFATARVHRIRYRFEGITWEDLTARLELMNWRGAIVGPEGAGKTTLLEDFVPRLRQRGWDVVSLRLTREQPCFPSGTLQALASRLTPSGFVLFDGAEQLSRWAWWRFRWSVRRAGGLVITSHRTGLLPTLIRCGTNPRLLAGMVADLLKGTGLPQGVQVEALFRKHRGNLREALRELYDLFSTAGEAQTTTRFGGEESSLGGDPTSIFEVSTLR
jgi:hypothetical protein